MNQPEFYFTNIPLEAARSQITEALQAAGVEDAHHLARRALTIACRLPPTAHITTPTRLISATEAGRLHIILTRLCHHEPLSKILHRREFYGLDIVTSHHVLDPRADTETLICAALTHPEPQALLELGIGSGALLVALRQSWPHTRMIGVDRSLEACKITLTNLTNYHAITNTMIICANWADALGENHTNEKFDLIISNPPYIPTAIIQTLSPSVKNYDPVLALDGGLDGLRDYALIFQSLARIMKPDGVLLFEIGVFSLIRLLALMKNFGLTLRKYRKDLSGKIRVLEIGFINASVKQHKGQL